MRIEYRGYYISDAVTAEGAVRLQVRPIGRNKVEWSQAGTGDHQVGRDYVDEKLDGKKKAPEVAGSRFMAMEKMANEYERQIWELQEQLTAAKELNSIQRQDVGKTERWMGMLLLNGEPTKGAINQAFKKQAKRWHPDQGGDAEVFKQLQEAKTQLLR